MGRPLAARYTLVAGLLGLIAGISEATLLYFAIPLSFIRIPLVHYVIWFVSPVVDVACFGVLGLTLGFLLSFFRPVRPWIDGILTCGLAGAAVACPVLAADHMVLPVRSILARHPWSQQWIYPLIHPLHAIVRHPLALVAAGGAVLLLLGRPLARRLSEIHWPIGILARVLGGALAVCLGGITFYAVTERSRSGSFQADSIPPARGPNIVLISLDTTRADHLSAYGYARATTPNLDRLARQGVLFENAISSSPWTLPSHASMFTGLLPHQHGASYRQRLRPEPKKLAEILRSYGYETAQFSANFEVINRVSGLTPGFITSPEYAETLRHHVSATLLGVTAAELYSHYDPFYLRERVSAAALNREVREWFEQRHRRPFFLFLNYYEPHSPYFAAKSEPRPYGDLPRSLAKRTLEKPGKQEVPLSQGEQAELINGYDNCVASLDTELGHLFQLLSGSAAWSKTVIIITADHGEAIGEHGVVGHGWNLYREQVHVPLIVLGPGVPDHLRIRQVVDGRDIFATVLDLALGGEGGPLRRSSLRRFWTESPAPPDEMVVSELSLSDGNSSMISLTTGEWKYIANSDGQAELYDRSKDAGETKNLASLPEYDGAVKELHNQLCQELGSTLDPLYGAQYLQAVQAAPNSSPAQAALSCGLRLPASPRRTPRPEDEDLLRTLPYR